MGFKCGICGCEAFEKITQPSEVSLIPEIVLIRCSDCSNVYAAGEQLITGALMKRG
jgi:hypothetical protein